MKLRAIISEPNNWAPFHSCVCLIYRGTVATSLDVNMDSIYPPEAFPYISSKFNLAEYFGLFGDLLTATFDKENEALENAKLDAASQTNLERIASLMKISSAECNSLHTETRLSLLDSDGEVHASKSEETTEWRSIPSVGTRCLATLVFQKGLISDKEGKKHVLKLAELRKTRLPVFNVTEEHPTAEASFPPKHIILTLRVYSPFLYVRGEKMKPPERTQDFLILGSQNLTALRDKIFCLNDSCEVGDSSPSSSAARIPIKQLIPSGMFFIGDTFYCDFRDPLSKDYGEWIENWIKGNSQCSLGPFQHKTMEETAIEDLEIRFGMPYLFIHLGACEHLISFIDARFISAEDVQDPNSYPLVEHKLPKPQYCLSCNMELSKWIVEDDERLPYNPAFLCDVCFQEFHFKDKEKTGTFKYYPYPQTPLSLVE